MNISTNIPNTKIAGFGFLFTALFLFACQDIAVKYLTVYFPITFLVWTRFAGNVVLSVVQACFAKVNIIAAFKTERLLLHLLRSLFLVLTTLCYFNAVKYIALTTAISIFFIYPLLIAALAPILIKESLPVYRWIFILTGMIGVLVVIRPNSSEFTWPMLYVVAGAFSFCFYSLTTRKLATTEPLQTTNLYTGVVGAILFLPSIFLITSSDFQGPDSFLIWALALSMGAIFGGLGHYFIIHANRRVPAPELASVFYTQIIWMIFADIVFFSLIPDRFTIIGCLIIIISNLFVIRIELNAARKLAAAQAMSGHD